MLTIHNCHTHVLTNQSVPNGFLPLGLARLIRIKPIASVLSFILRGILPFTKNDSLNRLAVFMGIGGMKSQAAILAHIQQRYPYGTKLVVLPMDLEYMQAGKAPKSYLDQLKELNALRSETVIPFIAADPRREGLTELVLEYLDKHKFGGIKLYPPLGFYPFDERLHAIYRVAEERQIPITAHCSRGGIYTRQSITEAMRTHPKTKEKLTQRKKGDFTENFTNPSNYKFVLEEFPNLKICLAHFGGDIEWYKYLEDPWPAENTEESWLSVIMDLIRNHPNVYTDISFTAYEKRFLPMIKVLVNTPKLREKILYGSDIYMVQLKESEREFSITLRGYLGEEDFKQIAMINPQNFLAHT